jgi:hypothetical protein
MGTTDALAALHRELGFEQHAPDLKKIQGIWKNLLDLQGRARKDPKVLKQYRAYLERCIKQLTEADPGLAPHEIDLICTEFIVWQEARYRELGVAAREAGRIPREWEQWCEKNLPSEWADMLMAFGAAVERPTRRTVDKLKLAYENLYQAYINTV